MAKTTLNIENLDTIFVRGYWCLDVVENKVLKSENVQKTNWAKKKKRLISHLSKGGIICFWEDHAYWKCKRSLVYFRQNLQRLQDKKGKVVDFKHRVWSSPK